MKSSVLKQKINNIEKKRNNKSLNKELIQILIKQNPGFFIGKSIKRKPGKRNRRNTPPDNCLLCFDFSLIFSFWKAFDFRDPGTQMFVSLAVFDFCLILDFIP